MTTEDAQYRALQLGEARYISRIPCEKGHVGERSTRTGRCCKCASQSARQRYTQDATEPTTEEKVRLLAKYGTDEQIDSYIAFVNLLYIQMGRPK